MNIKILSYRIVISITILCITVSINSCKKLVEVAAPVTSINSANVYANNMTAAAVLTGLYAQLGSAVLIGNQGVSGTSFFGSLSADELTLYNSGSSSSPLFTAVYTNSLTSQNTIDLWGTIYPL